MANQELKAAWYSLTFESRRSEHKRTRFEFVTYSRYPMSRLWVEDEVESVAKTAKFRYELKSNDFFILMYLAPEHDYGMGELRAQFKVSIHNWGKAGEDVDIRYGTFAGPDSWRANFEWNYSNEPMEFPKLPALVPKTPDVLKTSMFSPGMAHHQYPRVVHPSHLHPDGLRAHHEYAKVAVKNYGKIATRRMGLPSALPTFSMAAGKARFIGARKAQRDSTPS